MDRGDQPTCSKYYTEEKEEDYEMASHAAGDESQLLQESEGSQAEEYSPWQLNIPSTFLRQVAAVLHVIDVKAMRLVCRTWTAHLNLSLENSLRFAVDATAYQWEPIHYAHALFQPRIFPRMFTAGTFHPMTDKIYIFGGNGPQLMQDALDFVVQYNDVWTFDVHRKVLERVLVRGGPYPTPKSRSSIVAWKHYLVLFGGFRRPDRRRSSGTDIGSENGQEVEPFDNGFGRMPAEIHYLDVHKMQWEVATPVQRDGSMPPFGLHGHATVVYDKWMIVYGGFMSTPWDYEMEINTEIMLFDLEEKMWHATHQLNNSLDDASHIPMGIDLVRGTLAIVRPGRLLYHPTFPIRFPPARPQPQQRDDDDDFMGRRRQQRPPRQLPMQAFLNRNDRLMHRCYVLDFNPENMLGDLWRWTAYEVECPHLFRPVGALAEPIVVTDGDRVKLVNAVIDTPRTRRPPQFDKFIGMQDAVSTIKWAVHNKVKDLGDSLKFYDSLAGKPFEIQLDVTPLYRHLDTKDSRDAMKIIVYVIQGNSGHMGDYTVRARVVDRAWEHVHTKGVLNFLEQITVGYLPIKGKDESPHSVFTMKTMVQIRQSNRRVIKLLQADVTEFDRRGLSKLVWKETEERPLHEEFPTPATGLLLTQADGTIFVSGGESRPSDDGSIDTSIGGGTWIANPVK